MLLLLPAAGMQGPNPGRESRRKSRRGKRVDGWYGPTDKLPEATASIGLMDSRS